MFDRVLNTALKQIQFNLLTPVICPSKRQIDENKAMLQFKSKINNFFSKNASYRQNTVCKLLKFGSV